MLELVDEKPTSAMRSFAELLGNGRSRAEEVLGEDAPDDAWANITNTLDNLGSSSLLPNVIEEGSGLMLEESVVSGEGLKQEDRVMVDLSLKRKIRVVSGLELRWAVCRAQGMEFEALSELLGVGETTSRVQTAERSEDDGSGRGVERAKVEFYKSLINFRYPADALPMRIAEQWQFLIGNFGKKAWQMRPNGDLLSFAVTRTLRWQRTFQGLYFGFRHGRVREFYVLLSTTTVLFNRGKGRRRGMGVGGGNGTKRLRVEEMAGRMGGEGGVCLRACFAKASTGLRTLMSEYEVPFTILEGTTGFDEPCVVVEGQVGVHTLYNFLLSLGPKASNALDVPILLADRPFRGCTIACAEVSKARRAFVAGKQGGGKEERYSIELDGLFTPRQIGGICGALGVMQERDFVAHFETDTSGSMLNHCGHSGGERGEPGEGEGEEDEEGEEERWQLRGHQVLSKVQMSPSISGYSYSTRDAS